MSSSLNQMEFRSILVATVTIYCGLFYLTEDLDETTKIILFATIIIANFYFLLYWLAKMFEACIDLAKKKLPCFYIGNNNDVRNSFITAKPAN